MLEAVGSIAVSQLSRPEGKSSSSNSINMGAGFGEVMSAIREGRAVIAGSEGSNLLSFRKKEEEIKVESKVPEKESENIFDVIAKIREWAEDLDK